MSLEQTIDNLQIRNANMVTFVGTSNTMVDTTTGRIQTKGIQHNSNVITDVSGPHGRIGPTLKKYPEFIFEEGKFEANDSTKTYVRAGYTVSSSSTFVSGTDARVAWRAFDGNADASGNPPNIWQTHYANTFDNNSPYGIHTNNTTKGTFTADGVTYIGEWIKLKLPHKIKLNYLKWETSIDARRPKKGAILGSNNNSDWYTVKAFNNDLVWTENDVADYAHITSSSNSAYTYFMVVIEQVQGGDGSCWGNQISLYGYEDLATQGDHSVDTTFKSRFNNPQTTGVQVLVDGATGVGTNQISGGPDPSSGNQSTYVTDGKYWTLNGTLTSNLAVEANTFLEGDQPHAVSVWFNSSNLEANVSNTCVFSIASEEKLDSVNLDLQSNTWHNLTYAYQGEGGSRVTYLDGRKVAEDQAEDTFGDYPPFGMTGYSQGGYVASASSMYGTTQHPYLTFDNNTNPDDPYRWVCEDTKYNTDGSYAGTESHTDVDGNVEEGEWLKLELPHKLKVSYFKIAPYPTNGSQSWRNYAILGSNDDSTWYQVQKVSGLSNANGLTAGSVVPTGTYKNSAFKYFVFIWGNKNADANRHVAMGELKLYGHRENDLVRLPDPTNVLKYPHLNFTNHGTASTNGYHVTALRGYVVSASTKYSSGSNTDAWRAFDGVVDLTSGSGGQSWDSATNTYASSGTGRASTGTTTFNSRNGEWINIKFPHKVLLTSYQHWTRMDRDHEGPYSGYLYGSNDGFSTFQEIHRFAAITLPTTSGGVKYLHTVSSSYTPSGGSAVTLIPYNEYRLQVTHTQASPYLNIALLEFYGTEEASPVPIQIGGGNIDKVANFRVYDKFIEEDQVNEIWNAQKEEFGRAKPQMVLQQGKLGIGTDAPQGSLSVADEPHNLEEFPPRALSDDKTYIEGHGEFCTNASNIYTNSYAYKAFNKIQSGSGMNLHWSQHDMAGVPTYDNTTGEFTGSTDSRYLTNVDGLNVNGHWIQIEFPYKINYRYSEIQGPDHAAGRQPHTGYIVGSNDLSGMWTSLHNYSGMTRTGKRDFVTYTPPTISTQSFKYIRLVIEKMGGGNTHAGISQWRIFGTREQGQSVLHDGQLTLTKSLNVPRIGPPLDADDTPRRDRLVIEYNTSTNPTFEGAVRDTSGRGLDGIMYTATYNAAEKAIESNGNTGTSNNGPGGSVAGNANDYGSFETVLPSSLQGNPVFTVSGWFKQNTIAHLQLPWLVARDVRISANPGLSNKMHWLGITSTGRPRIALGGGGNLNLYYTDGSIKAGIWYHMVVVIEPTGTDVTQDHVRFYLDGVLQTTSNSGSSGTIDLGDGAPPRMHWFWQEASDVYYNGSASNLKIHECALTADEVKTLYDMGRCDEGHHVVNFSKTRVGIGLGDGEAPRGALDVSGGTSRGLFTINQTDGQWYNGTALRFLQYGTNDSRWDIGIVSATDDNFAFAYNGSSRGYFRWNGNNTVQNFTGQHRTFIKDAPFSQASNLEGLIVSSDQNKYIKMSNGIEAGSNAITMNESLPIVSLSNVVTDKKCFGVISASEDPEERSDAFGNFVSVTEKEKGDTRVYINSVGEGAIWVVNTNGSLESGDYITTSNVAGYGQKQNSEFLANYTVAKITMDCNFEPATQPIQIIKKDEEGENVLDEYGQIQWEDHPTDTEKAYKIRYLDTSGVNTDEANAVHIAAFVGCTYHCG